MNKLVNRQDFLQALESVSPGLSAREVLEQSNAFVFRGGMVFSFNDEIGCRRPSGLPDEVEGAVPSKPLLEVLSKLDETEVRVKVGGGEMLIIGERRRAGIRIDPNILLPLDAIEEEGEWKELPGDFAEAVKIVCTCAGRDADNFSLTCVHIHPKWLEACDDTQLCRWRTRTAVAEPTLVRSVALRQVANLGVTHFSETESWLHFKNDTGLVLSVRRYLGGPEEFPDLREAVRSEGTVAVLPKGLVDAADKANIFSGEMGDNNRVLVELTPGRLKIEGRGVTGWYRETKAVKWEGEGVTFLISPQLLGDLVKRHTEIKVGEGKLIVNGGGPYTYVAAMGKPQVAEEGGDEEGGGEQNEE